MKHHINQEIFQCKSEKICFREVSKNNQQIPLYVFHNMKYVFFMNAHYTCMGKGTENIDVNSSILLC